MQRYLPIMTSGLTLPLLVVSLFISGLAFTGIVGSQETLPEDVLATVNGKPVQKSVRDAVVSQLKNSGQQIDENQILNELVNLELLAQKAEEAGIDKRADIAAVLRLQHTQTLAQAFMGEMSQEIEITDDDLQAEYQKQTDGMAIDEFRASHILLDSEAAAAAIIKQLQDGADFAELAKTSSTGPTGPNGGDLGWFQAAAMVPEFSNAVKEMNVGEFSKTAVKSDFGWHVIKLQDKRGANKPKFDDIKGELRNLILRGHLAKRIEELRGKAKIVTAN